MRQRLHRETPTEGSMNLMSEELPMEPAETGTPEATPDDARRKVDELEERTVDEPDTDEQVDPSAATARDDEDNPDSPAAGESEPPD
ncbi:hypothetical protein GA0061091_13116 [Gordonia sp. v-85]|nr:hypothetical protein GA0061091_13116 [Gordonia sp. v-85]